MTQADYKYRTCKHDMSLRCLQTCTDWRLDVLKNTEGQSTCEFLGDFFRPTVSYKHCSEHDRSDLIDMLVNRNTNYAASSSINQQMLLNLHPTEDMSDQADRSFLEQSYVTYPIKNKTKAQNSVITNFQWDQALKEETFTLTFDISRLQLMVDASMTSNEYIFEINGLCHG